MRDLPLVRGCDGCTLCCRVMGVEELAKPPGVACAHATREGCGIYARRPSMCRAFNCYYLQNIELDARWKPNRAKFCLVLEEGRLVAYIDPLHPDAWKRAPYHAQLRAWAAANLPRGQQVVVAVGQRRIAVLPNGEIDLGIVSHGAAITVQRLPTGWKAFVG